MYLPPTEIADTGLSFINARGTWRASWEQGSNGIRPQAPAGPQEHPDPLPENKAHGTQFAKCSEGRAIDARVWPVTRGVRGTARPEREGCGKENKARPRDPETDPQVARPT